MSSTLPGTPLSLRTGTLVQLKTNVLVVDDTPANRMVYEAVLGAAGHNVLLAASGHQALEFALTHEIAVILLDVRMPGMDGFETAMLLRQREKTRHTPIIFMSAYDQDAVHLQKGRAFGAVDYVFSPVDSDLLQFKVQAYVDLYRRNLILTRQLQEVERLVESHQIRLATSKWTEQDVIISAGMIRNAVHRLRDDLSRLGSASSP